MPSWPKKFLHDIANAVRGTEPGSNSYTAASSGVRFLRVGDITGKTSNPVYTSAENVMLVKETDLLIALDGNPGYVATGFSGAISSAIRKIEPFDSKTLTKGWLRYALCSPEVQSTIRRHTRGATILHASTALKYIRIPIPPRAEQERIALRLGRVDVLRGLRYQFGQSIAALSSSIFLEMFGDPLRNTKGFPMARMEEIASIERGRFTPRPRNDPAFYGGEHPFIQTGDIANSGGLLRKWTQTLNNRGAAVSKSFPVGTVVMAIVGATIGETAILEASVYCPDSIVGLRAKAKRAVPDFIDGVLRLWRPTFLAQAPATARANLNLSMIRPLRIPLPPFELQMEFSRRLARVRALQERHSATWEQTDLLYASMMAHEFGL